MGTLGEMRKQRGGKSTNLDALRGIAEQKLAERETLVAAREFNLERLRHELEVHRIELELQNEELRAARAELERSLARYTQIFDFAPLGYALLRADETIAEINHAGARLLGRPKSGLSGVSFTEALVSARCREAARAFLQGALQTGVGESCEVTLIRLDGQRLDARLVASALLAIEPMVLLAIEDISLREASRRKDEFLAALSHELRNPLAPMRTSLGVLTRAEPQSEMARDAHAVLDRQLTHLTRLVDDLLDLTRIAQGKIALRCERLDFAELVRKTLNDHRAGFDASGIALEQHCEPGSFWVHADPTRLIQALSNLLSNALTSRAAAAACTSVSGAKALTRSCASATTEWG